MVRRPLQVRQHVGPHKAQLHGAAPLLHPPDAPGPQLLLQAVDDLLQGLHLRLDGGVLPTEGVQSQVRDLLHGIRQHPQLPAVLGRQGNVLIPQLLPAFQQVHGVIPQPLKIADQRQQLRRPGVGPPGQRLAAEHQECPQHVLHPVDALLLPPQLLCRSRLHLRQSSHAPAQVIPGQGRHVPGQLPAFFQGCRRGRQQPGVQLRPLLPLLTRQQPQHRPLQQSRRRKQQHRTQQVEGRVDHRHPRQSHGMGQHRRSRQHLHQPEHRQPHPGPGKVEQQVYQRRPAGIAAGPHGGQHGRDAGADVLPHNDGHSGAHRNLTAGGQGLQYPHGGGAGLDHRRQHRPGQQPQQRVRKGRKQPAEALCLGKSCHRAGHQLHSLHQCGKAQQGLAGIPAAAIPGQISDDAPQAQQGHEARRPQQPSRKTAPLQSAQAQQPGRHRGAYIGAYDDPHRLTQGQQSGVHESHHHHHSRRRALHRRRHRKTREKARPAAAGHAAQLSPQPSACPALESLGHDAHAE